MASSPACSQYSLPFAYRNIRSASSGFHPHHDQRLVVETLGVELIEIGKNLRDDLPRGQVAAAQEHPLQTAAPVLFPGNAHMIGNAVGKENDKVARARLKRNFVVLAIGQQTERDALYQHLDDAPVAADQRR